MCRVASNVLSRAVWWSEQLGARKVPTPNYARLRSLPWQGHILVARRLFLAFPNKSLALVRFDLGGLRCFPKSVVVVL